MVKSGLSLPALAKIAIFNSNIRISIFHLPFVLLSLAYFCSAWSFHLWVHVILSSISCFQGFQDLETEGNIQTDDRTTLCHMSHNEVGTEFCGGRWYLNWILKDKGVFIYIHKGKIYIYIYTCIYKGKIISSWEVEGTVYAKYSRAKSILKIIDYLGHFLSS